MDRLDALISWNKLQMSLQQQISALQKWTGSESLDVTKPNEPVEVSVVGENKESTERTGSTTFLERVLKEDSLQRTFEKDALVSIHVLIESARRVVTTRSEMFEELNLPSLENQLVQLISFPIKLIEASLHVRLESADRIQNPNSMVLDTMTDDIRLQIGLACTLKREYEALMEEDPDGKWRLPPSIPKGFDRVLLQSLLLFFKLLHWKLKGGAKGIYFKETDVLEAQEDLMDEVSMTVQGGSAVIAEQLWFVVLVSRNNLSDAQLTIAQRLDQ
jgi:mitogen-activated protein kinase kinase kinase